MELGFWIAFKVALGFSIGYGVGKVVFLVCKSIVVNICEKLLDALDKIHVPTENTKVNHNNPKISDDRTTKCKIGFH